ncbi:hypothetical protein HAHI6034_07585 [Hathewaya histolytica]|uniref:Peptidase family protein n=1 Tax=Hathewaya histolytica TaxID=1498 RepID=A0A4U9QWC4_HATHI|nr:hypothetical protein [Hathewaya histolytica]VTQ82955.1 peptidase family protein [Hathewaya histolytica]
MLDIIKELTLTYGISGEEDEVRNKIINEISDIGDRWWVDHMGNLIIVKKGDSKKRIMLTTNMDTKGLIVSNIMNNGLIKFITLGCQHKVNLYGQYVIFKNDLKGIIIAEKNIENQGFSGEVYIDIGSNSKKETESLVTVGDTAIFYSKFEILRNKILSSSLSNRSLCGVLVQAIKEVKELKNEVYFVFTAQQINGLKSLDVAISQINPEIMLMLDTTFGNILRNINFSIGGGPILNVIDSEIFCNPLIHKLLKEISKENSIKLNEAFNADSVLMSSVDNMLVNNIMGARITVPCQNLGSAFEMMDMNDLEVTKTLVKQFIQKV